MGEPPKILPMGIIHFGTEEFKEEDHPRDEDGKFTDKGGGSSSSDVSG